MAKTASMTQDSEKKGQEALVPQRRLLSFLLSKKVPPLPLEDERKQHPENKANFLSKIFFWWLFPVLNAGYKRTLEPEDLFTLTDEITVQRLYERFDEIFLARLARAQAKHIAQKLAERGETAETSSCSNEDDLADFKTSPWLTVWSIAKTFQWQYLSSCIFLVLANGGMTVNPLQSKKLIRYVEYKARGIELGSGKGVGYAIGCSFVVFVSGVLMNHYFYRAMLTGAQTKAVLTKAILNKSFNLSARSKNTYSTGRITSMMGTDLSRVDFALGFQPFVLTFPVPIAIAIGILIYNVGPVSLLGVALLLIFMFFMLFAAKALLKFRTKANLFTDKRVNYVKEVLFNMRVIKFYSWEPSYDSKISEIRKEEMRIIYRMQVLKNISISFAMSLTLFASMVTFLVLYAIKSKDRDAAAIFSSISLFNILSQQVLMLPMAIATGADAFIGLKRVGEFLGCSETNPDAIRIEADEHDKRLMDERNTAIEVKNAYFKWETFKNEEDESEKKESSNFITSNDESTDREKREIIDIENKTESSSSQEKVSDASSLKMELYSGLQNINVDIKKGEFVVITGVIGSGKSSLLSAMSGFMKCTDGKVDVNGSLLLCGQPWIQNETVKENIIFGSPFDEKRYREVIYACSLESDLDILPAGDKTEIGERGITLSGGQKARINLARAVYSGKDIILMDDVLSAVDSRVGRHIVNNCLLGLLKDKTRVLATHQLSLIGSADRVIYLNGDGSNEMDTLDSLMKSSSGFRRLMEYNSETKKKEEEEEDEEETPTVMEIKDLEDNEDEIKDYVPEYEDQLDTEREMIKEQLSRIATLQSVDEEAVHRDFNKDKSGDGKLFQREERAVNGISFLVYKNYVKYGGGVFKHYTIVPLILITTILATFSQLFTNTWLSFWTEKKFDGKSDGFYIGFYVMFTILAYAFLTLEFVFIAYATNKSSTKLNMFAIKRVLRAPMLLMDTTPMGRILNRFTKDTDVLDNEIGEQLRMLSFFVANIIGILILCICYLPWFAIAVPFLVFIYVATANYYQASAREVKRIEAVQRSSVYNNFNETLGGMDTIKAYKASDTFINKNDFFINKMNEAYYLTIANQRWLGIHLDFVATLLALIVALLCVKRVFNISPASVGLLLSYVLQIAGQLSMLLRILTQVENEMNSVERLCHYSFELPQEAPYYIPESSPAPSWPEKGSIKFEQASMAYREGLPLVLKNLNFEIKPQEKIGICGRTGAGKSSIMAALYRLSELQEGKILIDDNDISKMGLRDLRSKLSIIPQDPVLFKGTVRSNLDPFNEHQDDKLWESLCRAGLIEKSKLESIKSQSTDDANLNKFHLDESVLDDGSNFSLGERQLLAFARALVRDSKVLILDEATSSVDYETDSNIQRTIAREFVNCTILCIAHRLKTILNYDRILVLDKGEVKEFDTPWNLFKKEGGIFQQMCEKAKIVEEDF